MKKLLTFFTILISLTIQSQILSVDKNFDSNGCITSYKIKVDYDIIDFFEAPYYLSLTEGNNTRRIDLSLDSSGNDEVVINEINQNTIVSFVVSRRISSIFSIKIPITLTKINVVKCPKIDLTITEEFTKQISDCFNCNSYLNQVSSGSLRPTIFTNGRIKLAPLVIANIGDRDANFGSLKIRFYLSKDKKISNDDLGFGNRTITFNPPKAGESTYTGQVGPVYSPRLEVTIPGSDIGSQRDFGNYYLIIIIDEPNRLGDKEINKDNNITTIPVRYTSPFNNRIEGPINVNVISFQGETKMNFHSKNKEEANKIIKQSSIKNGLYIINYSDGILTERSKILKN